MAVWNETRAGGQADLTPDPGAPAAPGCWHLITGEYPPHTGGVADYSYVLAKALAATGAEVHVWAPDTGPAPEAAGVTVHRCAGGWSRSDLARLSEALDAFDPPRRLLVQYTPNAWGYRGLNLWFGRWLVGRRAQGDDVRPMIHEPFYPFWLRDKPTRWVLAAGHRWMFRTLLAASTQIYVAIPYWEKHLRAYEPRSGARRQVTWLPVPSNIPRVADTSAVAALRGRLAPGGEAIVGSFGKYPEPIRRMLEQVLFPLLAGHSDRVGLLLGERSEDFAAELRAAHPELAGRIVAPGRLAGPELSLHLQTCDVLVQTYPEGVNTRRGTVMAGLAHGIPIVTTQGIGTEPIWAETGCVALAPVERPAALVEAADALLADPAARSELGRRARETYGRHFDVQRSVEKILRS